MKKISEIIENDILASEKFLTDYLVTEPISKDYPPPDKEEAICYLLWKRVPGGHFRIHIRYKEQESALICSSFKLRCYAHGYLLDFINECLLLQNNYCDEANIMSEHLSLKKYFEESIEKSENI